MPVRAASDRLFKELTSALFQPHGRLETEKELRFDAKRIDAWFVPESAPPPRRTLGLLGRMAVSSVVLEGYSRAPSVRDGLLCCVRMVLLWEQLERDARQARQGRDARSSAKISPSFDGIATEAFDAPEETSMVALPKLWIISAGVPTTARTTMGFVPMAEWPAGFYAMPEAWQTHLVVVPELPVTRETLALRLMGRGKILAQAMRELAEARKSSLEWEQVARRVVDVSIQTPQDGPPDPDRKEFQMHARKLIRELEADARAEGREEGLQLFVRMVAERLARPLTPGEVENVRQRLRTHGGDALLKTVDGMNEARLETWLAATDLSSLE